MISRDSRSFVTNGYHVAGIFRGGVIFAFFAVEWDLRKIHPRKFMTRIHVRVVLQTVLSMKHVTAIVPTLFLGCFPCLVLREPAHFR